MSGLNLRALWTSALVLVASGPIALGAAPKIVILGSSTAQGVGASSYGASWVGLLTTALQPKGYVVQNVSISGTSTADSLARFDRDVAPAAPKFVLLATSIINEPPAAPVTTYIENTLALIRKVEAIHAIPILVAPYPNDSFSASMYASLRDIYAALDAEGVPVLDFLDGPDDGQGRWAKGLTVDGIHPTDTGHKLLFDSIPITIFDSLLQQENALTPHGYGSLTQNTLSTIDGLLEVVPPSAVGSWTASVWLKSAEDAHDGSFLTVNGDWLLVERFGDELHVSHRGALLGSLQYRNGPAFRHLAVTYQSITGEMKLYVGGVLAIRATVSPADMAESFTVGSAAADPGRNAVGNKFADFMLYRAPLAAADIRSIQEGRTPWKSVEAWLPLTSSPARPNLNLAPTAATVIVHGNWKWTSDGVGPLFPKQPRGKADECRSAIPKEVKN